MYAILFLSDIEILLCHVPFLVIMFTFQQLSTTDYSISFLVNSYSKSIDSSSTKSLRMRDGSKVQKHRTPVVHEKKLEKT